MTLATPSFEAVSLPQARFMLTAATLTAALLFGGAARQGVAADAVPELMALPLLALSAYDAHALARRPAALALALGLVAIPALQLIPLPAALWAALPGRDIVNQVLAAAGIAPAARPVSLVPSMTLRALLALVPPLAVFLGASALDAASRLRLLAMVVAAAAANALAAAFQVAGGGLYLYAVTNPGRGVGLFANANHFAALEYAALPLAAVVAARMKTRPAAAFAAFAAPPVVGLALSGSRAALGLGALAALGALALSPLRARLVPALALALPLAFGAVLTRILSEDAAHDARWSLAPRVLEGVRAYWPVGAGVGVFPAAFPLHERLPDITAEFVNRAHDDALELLFEGGAPSLALAAAFLVWLALSARRAFRRRDGVALAGLLAMALLLLHSLVDYPLRTIALGAVFAALTALQIPAAEAPGAPFRWRWRWRRRRRSRRVHRRNRNSETTPSSI